MNKHLMLAVAILFFVVMGYMGSQIFAESKPQWFHTKTEIPVVLSMHKAELKEGGLGVYVSPNATDPAKEFRVQAIELPGSNEVVAYVQPSPIYLRNETDSQIAIIHPCLSETSVTHNPSGAELRFLTLSRPFTQEQKKIKECSYQQFLEPQELVAVELRVSGMLNEESFDFSFEAIGIRQEEP